MEESYPKVERERSHRGLIGVLAGLVVVIVGLVVGIVVVRLNNNDTEGLIVNDDDVLVSNTDVDCYYHFGDVVECENYVADLENEVLNSNGSGDEYVDKALELAFLYSGDDLNEAIEVLNNVLGAEMTDSKRYDVLMTLLSYYREASNNEKEKEVLAVLVELPDDMELEHENWANVKTDLISELNRMNEEENE